MRRRSTTGLAGGVLAVGLIGSPVAAQSAIDPTAALDPGSDPRSKDITVTGSRLQQGSDRLVPVTTLTSNEIAAQIPANLADLVSQLPSVSPGSTAGNSSGNLSNGLAGIASINLRGLGVTRSLVLIDGRRSVGSAITGVVDINTIPQGLVRRVEVVTGGASAQYGSDAIGGVVNFILDTDRKGLSLKADQGLSTYGDGAYTRLEATAGFSLLQDRLHLVFDADWFRQKGSATIDRPWNGRGVFQINNPGYTAANGQPERLVGNGFAPASYTPGGLITSGPLRGTYFKAHGQTGQLTYGAYVPAVGSWMRGGDTAETLAGHLGTNSLIPDEKRIGIFQRTSFEVSGGLQLFGQFAWNRYQGQSAYQQTPSTGIAIQADNAFLRTYYPQVAAALATLGQSSITIGTSNAGFPVPGSRNQREVYRFLAGAEGHVSLFGRAWEWQGSFQHGGSKAREVLANVWNVGRMALAQDAVMVGGQIVCRSSVANAANGCVPIERLGIVGPSAAALDYVYGAAQPRRDTTIRQDVASLGARGTIFDLPGGTAALALGAEWRREAVSATADSAFRSGWLYGNYQPARGNYTVREAYAELELPVLPGVDLNGAARVTDYSTSGTVATWKAGANWTVIGGLRLRGTYSRDIRAPNLSDLFAGPTSRTNSVLLPVNAPVSGAVQMLEQTLSNRELKPERARSWTAGTVLTPALVPGLSLSFDYFSIGIHDAIGTVTAQNTVNLCYAGANVYCPNLVFTDNVLTSVIVRPLNFASQRERGFDIEARYRTSLASFWLNLPGSISVSALLTHTAANIVDNGVFPVDYAGLNGDSTFGSPAVPSWSYRASGFWEVAPVTLNVVARGFGAGVYGNDFIECTTNCPASSARHRTINDNHIAGAIYFDASMRIDFAAGQRGGAFTLAATNLFNRAPASVGNGPDGNNWPAYAQTNRLLYDVVGRVVRASLTLTL